MSGKLCNAFQITQLQADRILWGNLRHGITTCPLNNNSNSNNSNNSNNNNTIDISKFNLFGYQTLFVAGKNTQVRITFQHLTIFQCAEHLKEHLKGEKILFKLKYTKLKRCQYQLTVMEGGQWQIQTKIRYKESR
jgi:hypothetical protein